MVYCWISDKIALTVVMVIPVSVALVFNIICLTKNIYAIHHLQQVCYTVALVRHQNTRLHCASGHKVWNKTYLLKKDNVSHSHYRGLTMGGSRNSERGLKNFGQAEHPSIYPQHINIIRAIEQYYSNDGSSQKFKKKLRKKRATAPFSPSKSAHGNKAS